MAVFLTGSTGFLGQWLVQALTLRRMRLKVLVRPNQNTSFLPPEWVEPIVGDTADASVVTAAMSGCDTVIHAGLHGAGDRRADLERVHVDGFRHVMDAAWHHGVKHVVHVSSFFTLGPSFGEVRNEVHMRGELRNPTEHERAMSAAEGLTRSYVSGGLPLSVVYPTLLYGPGAPGGGNLLASFLLDRAKGRLNTLPFDNGHRLSLAYVDDVAEGICRVLSYGGPGDRYILGGENRTLHEILRTFTAVGGLRGSACAGAAGGRLSRLAAWSSRLARKTSPETRRIIDLMQEDWSFSSARAKDELGYSIRPLADGMKRTVEDLRDRGLLSEANVNARRS